MTVSEHTLGMSEDIELVKDGGAVPVTSENRLLYISSYCNYMLNVRTMAQTQAFTRGLRKVIP
jgi:hypothetical protein